MSDFLKTQISMYLCDSPESRRETLINYLNSDGRTTIDEHELDKLCEHRGTTLLCDAISDGDIYLCELLLEAGANVNTKSTHYKFTALHYAAMTYNREMQELFIGVGADVNAIDNVDRWTPLHLAAENGNTTLCTLLLNAGANPCLRDGQGLTALHYAKFNKYPGVVDVLKQAMHPVHA